jgi:hypothetical protein
MGIRLSNGACTCRLSVPKNFGPPATCLPAARFHLAEAVASGRTSFAMSVGYIPEVSLVSYYSKTFYELLILFINLAFGGLT